MAGEQRGAFGRRNGATKSGALAGALLSGSLSSPQSRCSRPAWLMMLDRAC